ncbi:Attractin, partial [Dissostichus eleginoides]
MYRKQLLREMQQMASRPFATINVALETDEEPPDLIGGNVKLELSLVTVDSGRLGALALTGAMHLRGSAATQGYSQRPQGKIRANQIQPKLPASSFLLGRSIPKAEIQFRSSSSAFSAFTSSS